MGLWSSRLPENVSENVPKKVEIVGSYELEKERDENLSDFLKDLCMPPWICKQMLNNKLIINVMKDPKKDWSFQYLTDSGYISKSIFNLGEGFCDVFYIAVLVTSTTTMEGDYKFVTESNVFHTPMTYTKCCTFDDYGMIMTLKASHGEKVATRYFKRVPKVPLPEKSKDWKDVELSVLFDDDEDDDFIDYDKPPFVWSVGDDDSA